MKFSLTTTAAVGLVALVGLVNAVPAAGVVSDVEKRDNPPLQYFTVQAPPENISPAAAAEAAALEGLVSSPTCPLYRLLPSISPLASPVPSHFTQLTIVSLQLQLRQVRLRGHLYRQNHRLHRRLLHPYPILLRLGPHKFQRHPELEPQLESHRETKLPGRDNQLPFRSPEH